MRPIICGGIRYDSINECVDRTEYTVKMLRYALEVTGHIGAVSIEYADDPADALLAETKPAEPEAPRATFGGGPLLPGLCTHRLGTYHGGRY